MPSSNRNCSSHLELAAEDERRRADPSEGAGRAAVLPVPGASRKPWTPPRSARAALARRSGARRAVRAAHAATDADVCRGRAADARDRHRRQHRRLQRRQQRAAQAAGLSERRGTGGGLAHRSGRTRAGECLRRPPPLGRRCIFTYAENNRTFQDFGLWFAGAATVTGPTEPEEVRTLLVTDGTLQAFGVQPVLGRWLAAADQTPGAPQTVMLGYGYWQRRFGGDRSVVGRGIIVDSRPREIVGVMPEGFRVTARGSRRDRAARLRSQPPDASGLRLSGRRPAEAGRDDRGGQRRRRADGADLDELVAGGPRRQSARSTRAGESRRRCVLSKRTWSATWPNALWVLMGTIGIVMLIACANVANLLLVRADGRQQELAVRAALGAGRGRIVRGLLIESVVLGLMGGVLGLGLAHAGLRFLVAAGPATLPRLDEIPIDARALAFTLRFRCSRVSCSASSRR